jgi:hypothetical protein
MRKHKYRKVLFWLEAVIFLMFKRNNPTPFAIIIYALFVVMTALSSDPVSAAFALIPAQVPGAKHPVLLRKDRSRGNVQLQTAKDVVSLNQYDVLSDDDSAGDEVVYNPVKNDRQDVTKRLSSTQSSTADEASAPSQPSKNQRGRNKSFPRHGNLPDVHWRAIPMSHLRSHPNFKPLPPSSLISKLPTKEHARLFRQESWQWDYLHQGRCTTSQAAAALGFLEPRAAEYLGIPKSLQRGGGGAWQRLRQDSSSIDRLEEMERILCESRNGVDINNWRPGRKEAEKTWTEASKLKNSYPFVAKYIPTVTDEELFGKKMQMQKYVKHASSLSTRMHWGNTQEATSILTALNYFCGIDNRTTICEVGMCGARFDDLRDSDLNGLKIGASPDAIICHGDGTVEVLEVKNHCPFAWNRTPFNNIHKRSGKKNKKGRNHTTSRDANNTKLFSIKDFELECKVPPVYIAQLMMEMFCLGDSVSLDSKSKSVCKSSIMVRQTGSKGAIILRLRRDEKWINEMKYFLGEFKKRYVDAGIIPHDDFFFGDDDANRYEQFLHRTKELSESVEQVAYIPHSRIQRMVMSKWSSYESPPMFLDDVELPND